MKSTRQKTFSQFVTENGIAIEPKPVKRNPNMRNEKPPMNHWRVVLKFEDRIFFIFFSKGVGLVDELKQPAKPTADEVLQCLAMDSSVLNYSLADWCDDQGWNRESVNSYTACLQRVHELKKFLGPDKFEELLTCEE